MVAHSYLLCTPAYIYMILYAVLHGVILGTAG